MKYNKLVKEFRAEASEEIAEHSAGFFKTGEGEYGEGDIFLGIRVPVVRKYAKKYLEILLPDVQRILKSKYHEERLLAVILLVEKYKLGSRKEKLRILDIYLSNTKFINNWDIVDVSAHFIVGPSLKDNRPARLKGLAKSGCLWERRIAIISTFYFIRQSEFYSLLVIAEMLLDDKEDLIHKAVGWMLREAGKRDLRVEEDFLRKHYKEMPRTMLRYAIERFPEKRRQGYLKGRI